MEFGLSEKQKETQQAAREFAARVMAPIARECDDKETMPREVFERAFKDGILTAALPVEYGGMGGTALDLIIIVEELAAACCGMTTGMFLQYLAMEALLRYGTEEQKRQYVGRFCEQLTFASFAATDAATGQDVGHSATRATRHGDHYVLNGEKQFITNARLADFHIVIARTEDPPNEANPKVSQFIVPKETPGVTVGPPVKKLGQRASDTASIHFDNAAVPVRNLIGTEGSGLAQTFASLMKSRTIIASMGVGIASAALRIAVETGERRRWRRPVLFHEHYVLRLGRMSTNIAAARLLTYNSAWMIMQGTQDLTYASRAKLFGGEVAMTTANEVVEMLGGMGYTRDFLAEKLLRDAKLLQIAEGPTTMQQRIVGSGLVDDVERWLAT